MEWWKDGTQSFITDYRSLSRNLNAIYPGGRAWFKNTPPSPPARWWAKKWT